MWDYDMERYGSRFGHTATATCCRGALHDEAVLSAHGSCLHGVVVHFASPMMMELADEGATVTVELVLGTGASGEPSGPRWHRPRCACATLCARPEAPAAPEPREADLGAFAARTATRARCRT